MYNFSIYFILFIIYSCIGWLMEVIVCSFHEKKLVNRGFLIGPYCPIYGVCSILMILLLNKYLNDPIALFVMATLICSIIEYLTSYLMEKLFHVRWWDYTHMKFNINGRICLSNSILFGALGLLLMYIINPFLKTSILLIPNIVIYVISTVLFIIFSVDVCVSFNVINKFKLTVDNVKKDYTEEISKKVRETLYKKSLLIKRLANAFPNIHIINKNKKRGN